MVDYNRYRVLWTGGPGGDGVSTFYTLSEDGAALAAIRSFYANIGANFTSSITWTFPNAGDVLDMPSGLLVGSWSEASAASVTGSGSGAYAAGVGCRVVWETGGIVGGRRVRGATFLTGLVTASYQTNGTLVDVVRAALEEDANDLVAAASLAVWSRDGGGISSVASARVPDKVSWLRTRRE